MKPRPAIAGAWLDRRRRKWAAWWGGHFRPVQGVRRGTLAILCDCEGHYAGADGEQFADAGLAVLLDMLARHRVRITFNVVAELCRSHPQRVRHIARAGHEIACHGWQHERPRDLDTPQLDAMLAEARACFHELKLRASGFRSPQSAWSLRLMQRLPSHGFTWSAERDAARRPYWLTPEVKRVPVLVDDWELAERRIEPRALMTEWRGRIGRAVARDRIVAVGIHEWLFGREPAYAAAFAAHLEWLVTHLEVELVTVGELAGPAVPPRVHEPS